MIRLISLLLFVIAASGATAQALVSNTDVALSVQDLEADLQRVPAEARLALLSRPPEVKNNLSNLFVRRVLASDAIKAGVDKDPIVKAALDLARDRVLSDLRLAMLDKAATPNQQALEAFAKTTYNANPKRFAVPEKIKIRHLLIRAEEIDARAQAEQLLKDIKAGADFADLAKSRSQDPGSAVKGGDLGWVARGRLVAPFEEAAFLLANPGALSNVVETQYGFHIIRLDDRQPASVQGFDEVKDVLVKESLATLTSKARQAESDRILAEATFDTAAIERLANSQHK